MNDETKELEEVRDEMPGVGGEAVGSVADTEAGDSENTETEDTELLDGDEEGHSDYKPVNRFDASVVHHLSGMYQNWFLDYASYVILERAVPHIGDGLKPVQRRILHTMKRMDDGRLNKVANIVGETMKFHPHGDASIGDALVQLGQKDLLIDTQGNWGNILTGDRAAAPRYIEARLTKFALEVAFNPKTTDWQLSYDGRNKEPITLPVKFPLLLAQGAEGIAVGLASKILPHNFNELCDAAISSLHGEDFRLYPDFPTGGSIDVAKYNGGQRGGVLRVRAKIEKLDSKTLVIKEIPFSKTTSTLIDSILRAVEKGKIKARRVDDNTAAEVEILIHLAAGVSPDKTIDALYAFSDCEINISPNCCVIEDKTPCFLAVEDVLRHSAEHTKALLRRELEIRRDELQEQLFFTSLEKIFIEEGIYKEKGYEKAPDMDAAIDFIDSMLTPFKPQLVREVTREDILQLTEIKMKRILKFNKDKADELMRKIKAEMKETNRDLRHMTEVTVRWFEHLKEKYGADHPRRTEIRNFDTIEAAKVAEANEKLYINRHEGFIGTALKKDEFVCNCSDLDDVIVFFKDGKYKVTRVADKIFVGKNVIHVQVFKKNDRRTTYNAIYRDGKQGYYYAKRFNMTTMIRDKDYDLTRGTPDSKVVYFTANPNGEAEVVKVSLEPTPLVKKLFFDFDFAKTVIKGRGSRGYLISKKTIHRVSMKAQGHSTLGGRNVWYDADVNRINYDGNGLLLGEFKEDDHILVILKTGEFYFSTTDTNNHFEDNILRIEKFDAGKVWTAVVADADSKSFPYVKRVIPELGKRRQTFTGDNPKSQLLLLTDEAYPLISVTFTEDGKSHAPMEIDAESFVEVKSIKAKGRRIASAAIATIEELPPTRFPEEDEPLDEAEDDGATTEDNPQAEAAETAAKAPEPEPATPPETADEEPPAQHDDYGPVTLGNTITFKVDEDGQMNLFQ